MSNKEIKDAEKRGSKQQKQFSDSIQEQVNKKYKSLQESDKDRKGDRKVPTFKARQINNIVKNATPRTLEKTLAKINNVFDSIENKKENDARVGDVKKLRKILNSPKAGRRFGSLYSKLQKIAGLSTGSLNKFSPSATQIELTGDTKTKFNEVVSKAIGEDVLSNLTLSEVNAILDDVVNTMKEANVRKKQDKQMQMEIIQDIISDSKVNLRESADDSAQLEYLSEKHGMDEDYIRSAYESARTSRIKMEVNDRISTNQNIRENLKKGVDDVANNISQEYSIEKDKAIKLIENSPNYKSIKETGVQVGSSIEVNELMEDNREAIENSIETITTPDFQKSVK